jgi:ABC-type phosphonate transport system ATPase subunit
VTRYRTDPPGVPPDIPLEWSELPDHDKLGFLEAAPKLSRVVALLQPPACFGIFGDWGTGKSTMMKAVEANLAHSFGGTPLTVWFNTWKYDQLQGDELLFALLRTIESQTATGDKWREVRKTVMLGGMLGASAVTRLWTAGTIDITENVDTAVHLLDKAMKAYDRWSDSTSAVEESFQAAVLATLEKKKADRLFVFLDDLDRCLPASITRLLEKLKNALLAGKVVFVLGADRSAIVDAICGTYGTSRLFGERYLDKITVMSYDIRPRLAFEGYRAWLSQSCERLRVDGEPGWGDMALYEAIPRTWTGNPRTVKRVVEKLSILATGVLGEVEHPNLTYKDGRLSFTGGGLPECDTPNLAMKLVEFLLFVRERLPVSSSWYSEGLFFALHSLSAPATRVPGQTSLLTDRATRVLDESAISMETATQVSDVLFKVLKARPEHIRVIYEAFGTWL